MTDNAYYKRDEYKYSNITYDYAIVFFVTEYNWNIFPINSCIINDINLF